MKTRRNKWKNEKRKPKNSGETGKKIDLAEGQGENNYRG